jgi:hypothetical protein
VPPPPLGKDPVARQPGNPATYRLVSLLVALVVGGWIGIRPGGGPGPEAFWLFGLGLCAAVNLQILGLWLAGRLTGVYRVVWQSVGVGRWLGRVEIAGRLVVLRALPMVLWAPCMVVVAGARHRRWRIWAGSLVRFAVELALVVACAVAGWWALGTGLALALVISLLSRPKDADSRSWALFRLPFGDEQARLAAITYPSGTLVRAHAALSAGHLATARRLLDAATAEGTAGGAAESDGSRPLAVRGAVLLAEGRYAEAATAATALHGRSSTPRARSAAALSYATALALGTEAGVWSPAETAAAFRSALALVPPTVAVMNGLTALDRLLTGNPAEAARLSARVTRFAADVPTRAQAFCTLAAARSLTGDRAGAAKALAAAERLAPELPRIAVVRGLTGVGGGAV